MNEVPHLTTALSGPLLALERRILKATPAIENWLQDKWQKHATPFYSSVDLRNSGFNLALVDTNLCPGGFNNLNPDFDALCVQATMRAVEKICLDARGVQFVQLAFEKPGETRGNLAAGGSGVARALTNARP